MNKGLLSQLPPPSTGKTGWPWTEETNPIIYQNKDWPKISIVTPSYNQGQFIEETIRSILLQNYPNLEYIIMDGGSNDGTVDVIKKYAAWITFWTSEKDNGQSHAINKGIEKCTADIFNWINSDDVLLQGALQQIAPCFNNLEIGCVAGRCSFIDEARKRIDPVHKTEEREHRILCGTASTYQPASFFRLSVLKNNLGNLSEDLHYAMDLELYTTIGLASQIHWIEQIVCLAKLHDDSKTISHIGRFAEDHAKIFSKALRSVQHSETVIREMKKLDLYIEGMDKYPSNKDLSPASIMMSFNYFLLSQLYFVGQSNNQDAVKKIVSYLKKEQPTFYKEKRLYTFRLKMNKAINFLWKMREIIRGNR